MKRFLIETMNQKSLIVLLLGLILLMSCISQPKDTPQEMEQTPTEYAQAKGISPEVVDSLAVLGNDGTFSKHEKTFIDILSGLPDDMQDLIINSYILKDETVDNNELEFITETLEHDALTMRVLESNLLQHPIDNESVAALRDIITLYTTDKELALQILQSYSPEFEIQLRNITQNSTTLHDNAWEMVLDKAKEDQYYTYSIYATRTLAVKHPELYLKADGLFAEIITTNTGFKKAYTIKDVHDIYFYGHQKEGPAFSFDDINFQRYTTIKSHLYYPEGYPVFPFLDRRVLPLASTLKSAHNQLTQLEKGVQYYCAQKTDENEKRMYLIYCENENTYLFDGSTFLYIDTLEETQKIDGNPILIFNEYYVWYPLMGRDDSSMSLTLKELVEPYSTTLPSLTDFEAAVVEELKAVTELTSHLQEDMAVMAAFRPYYNLHHYIFSASYANVWDSGINLIAERRFIYKRANYLSPITAYLAATAGEHLEEEKIRQLTNEYLKNTRIIRNYAHGHTWFCELVEQTIEESYTTKAGHCIVQAANLAAVLDLARIDYYWLQGFADPHTLEGPYPHGHDWLYIPEYDLTVSNGKIESYRTILCYQSKGVPFDRIDFVGTPEQWAYFPELQLVGTLSLKELIEILRKLIAFHEEEILILEIAESGKGISVEDFAALLEES